MLAPLSTQKKLRARETKHFSVPTSLENRDPKRNATLHLRVPHTVLNSVRFCSSWFAARSRLCYTLDMREWMRERMRRRSKRGPNTSESTGKIGQELPQNQPAPLQPSYHGPGASEPDQQPPADASPQPELAAPAEPPVPAEPPAPAPAAQSPTPKVEVETQPESLSTPPPEPAPGAGKGARGYVVLTIGLPGSGKTTWFKRRGVTPLSSDLLRTLLFDDITEQRWSGLVFSTLRSLLRARLIAKMPWNYVDATNLSPHERRQWIKMAKSFGYEVQAVFFDVPLEVCLERNKRRERTVSEDVMKKMADRLRAPDFKEGFSKITVVRVKGAAPTGSAATAEE
jgi:predicted kinase